MVDVLDAYARRARLAPALVAAVPPLAIAGAAALSPNAALRIAGIALGGVGLVVCGLVRDRGRNLEADLWASWGGSPTLRRLRWRDAPDQESVRRLHDRVSNLIDEPLPDPDLERADPEGADRRYNEAVAVLRERTRGPQFHLVFAENMEYGFRRNSLGLRPIALGIAGGALALSLALLALGDGDLSSRWARWGVSAAISIVAILYWWRIVRLTWVRRAAELYADRLFEAVETVRAGAHSESHGQL